MWKASCAFRSLRRIRCAERGWHSFSALAEKPRLGPQEAMNCEEYEYVARKLSSILSGMRIASSLQSSVCSPPRLVKQIAFFKNLGIHPDGFCKIISVFPHALILDPDTDLKVTVGHLGAALGSSLLMECIMSWPSLLGLGFPMESAEKSDPVNLNDGLGPTLLGSVFPEFKAELFQQLGSESSCKEAIIDVSHSQISILSQDFSAKVDFLLKCGFKKNTRLLARALFCALHKTKQGIDAIVYALMVLGLSRKHSCRLIRLQPPILQQGTTQITLKLDYIFNTLGFSMEELFKYSSFMLYDLDTYIRPRYLMHDWIKSKRLLRRNFRLDYVMSLSEKQFLRKFVECHDGGANAYHRFIQSPSHD